jgi:microcystin degradation protein MlrC
MPEPAFRVLSAQISHETNTFSKRPTTLDHYKARQFYRGAEIAATMGRARMEMAAHLDVGRRLGWDIRQPIAAFASPSGKTIESAWQWMKSLVLEECRQLQPDGIVLALHGAMVTEEDDDAEGTLLEELRQIAGPSVPIAVTLDLHANVTDRMGRLANLMIAYRTYPHVDLYEVGADAAELLHRMMTRETALRTVVARSRALFGCNHGRTQEGPMVAMLARAERLQKEWAERGETLRISVCAGFPWADVLESGPSATVSGTGGTEALEVIARGFAEEIYRTREELTVVPVSVEAAVARALATAGAPGGCLLLSDFTDNPGHGGYGDGVRLLGALVAANVRNAVFGCVADPQCVQVCRDAGIGAEVVLELGAKEDPVIYGPSLKVTGTVECLNDGRFVCEGPMMAGLPLSVGNTAVVRVGDVRVLVSSENQQSFDRQMFISQGIDPSGCDVVVVKSAHHFRGSFGPLAREILLVDAGGLVSHDVRNFPYERVRRPVWPLDPM